MPLHNYVYHPLEQNFVDFICTLGFAGLGEQLAEKLRPLVLPFVGCDNGRGSGMGGAGVGLGGGGGDWGIRTNLCSVACPGFGLFTDKLQDLRPHICRVCVMNISDTFPYAITF